MLLSSRHLEDVLTRAGAEVTPEAIHLARGFYETALLGAREIRNRYTFFDLSAQSGRLADAIAYL